jgi:hypothetical protein
MSLLDKIPGLNLYIGGYVHIRDSSLAWQKFRTNRTDRCGTCSLFTLRRKQALQDANITHVLSVLRLPLDQDLFKGFQHMVVEVDDVEDENLLEHFHNTNAFIREGLDSGGGVLVHWYVPSFAISICCLHLLHDFTFEFAFGDMTVLVVAALRLLRVHGKVDPLCLCSQAV